MRNPERNDSCTAPTVPSPTSSKESPTHTREVRNHKSPEELRGSHKHTAIGPGESGPPSTIPNRLPYRLTEKNPLECAQRVTGGSRDTRDKGERARRYPRMGELTPNAAVPESRTEEEVLPYAGNRVELAAKEPRRDCAKPGGTRGHSEYQHGWGTPGRDRTHGAVDLRADAPSRPAQCGHPPHRWFQSLRLWGVAGSQRQTYGVPLCPPRRSAHQLCGAVEDGPLEADAAGWPTLWARLRR